MTREWGPPTWYFFHTFAEKINPEFYQQHIPYILQLFKNICAVLPCPTCQQHATQYMSKIQVKHVLTKEKFREMLWTFHNAVNQRLKKPLFTKKELEVYKTANLRKITSLFQYHMYRNFSLNRGFSEQMYRRKVTKTAIDFIVSNQGMFI